MALTNEDLMAISQLFDSRLDSKLEPLKIDMQEMKNDITYIKDDITGLKTDVSDLRTDVSDLKTDVSGLKTDVSDLKIEVSGLKSDVSRLKTDVTCIKLDIEHDIKPQIQLLAENYVPAANRFEKTSIALDTMQSDVELMKKVITEHSAKLQQIS